MKKFLLSLFIIINFHISAQTYLSDDFNYGSTAGNLCGSGGVTSNWAPTYNAGTNPVQYITTNLSYLGYSSGVTASSGAMSLTVNSSIREWVYTPVQSINSGSVYVTFLLKSTTTGSTSNVSDFFMYLTDTLGATDTVQRAKFFIQAPLLIPGYKLGISKGGSSQTALGSTTYSSTNTVLVILKYVFNTSTSNDDSVYAWMYTSGVPVTEPAPMLVATDVFNSDLPRIRSLVIKQTTSSILSAPITIDAIRIGASWGSTALPVSIVNFSAAEGSHQSINLNWKTTSELNNDHFEIERSISSGPQSAEIWEVIGHVKGNGTSNTINNYQFSDHINLLAIKVLAGQAGLSTNQPINNTYRLKQVDKDGNFSFSEVVQVNMPNNPTNEISIYPNPAQNSISISGIHQGELNIYSATGIKLLSFNQEVPSTIDISSLSPGVYFVEAITSNKTSYRKIIRE